MLSTEAYKSNPCDVFYFASVVFPSEKRDNEILLFTVQSRSELLDTRFAFLFLSFHENYSCLVNLIMCSITALTLTRNIKNNASI